LGIPKANVVGLDLGSRALTLVQLEKKGVKFFLRKFGVRWLPRGIVQDGTILNRQRLVPELQSFIEEYGVSGQSVVVSVSGPSVIVKPVRVSAVGRRDLDEYFQWEGPRYLSHPVEDLCLDHQIIGTSEEGLMDVLLVAAKRDAVESRQVLLKEVGLNPVGCDVDGLALANMASLAGKSPLTPHLIVNLELEGCTVVTMEGGWPRGVNDLSWDDEGIDQATHEELLGYSRKSEIDILEKDVAYPAFPWVTSLAESLKRTLNISGGSGSIRRAGQILVSGNGASSALCETLAGEVSLPVILLHPFRGIDTKGSHLSRDGVRNFASSAGVAVGLAVRSDCHE